jgi:hypothetical protein
MIIYRSTYHQKQGHNTIDKQINPNATSPRLDVTMYQSDIITTQFKVLKECPNYLLTKSYASAKQRATLNPELSPQAENLHSNTQNRKLVT